MHDLGDVGWLQRRFGLPQAINRIGNPLSGSNATRLVSRYSCRATLVSHFSPYVFLVSHENRATPLKVSQKRPCRTLLGRGVTPQVGHAHTIKSCRDTGGVAATVSRVALHTVTLREPPDELQESLGPSGPGTLCESGRWIDALKKRGRVLKKRRRVLKNRGRFLRRGV